MKTNLYCCVFSLFLWIGSYHTSFACLNLYGTNFHGEETLFESTFGLDYLFEKILSGEELRQWKIRKDELESSRSYNPNDWKTNSDYCVALLHVGETQKAIEILEDLIRKYPDEYNLNANLGTAYELSGNLEKAKFFMEKAIKINPASHHSSEWIHLKILEAKINMQKNPTWLQSNLLLGWDFGNEEKPVFSKNKDELRALGEAIEYQLSERMQFVKPKDVIVGDLLFLLGDAYGLT